LRIRPAIPPAQYVSAGPASPPPPPGFPGVAPFAAAFDHDGPGDGRDSFVFSVPGAAPGDWPAGAMVSYPSVNGIDMAS